MNPDIQATRNSPPTFLRPAENDPVDRLHDSPVYCVALKNVGVSVATHRYAERGYAFGPRRTKADHGWPQFVETRLRTMGMISD
ncbi:MAG TPA: hypothetical protein VKB21_08590 [Candidatus Acidoferrum sp.]|nr:hypothetical protein [Candidatus Acidoferrum sp.]